MVRVNDIKRKLKNGEPVFGTFVKAPEPSVVEALAFAGFDFIIIDNEHTAMNMETITNLIRAAELHGMLPTVRVKQKTAAEILQVLDAGAMGVQVPQVDTRTEADNVVKWAKYAPVGERGYAASQRSAGYGSMNPVTYAQMSNDNTLVICYCETKTCVDNLDDILQVEGVDVIFIGPFDLSQSYGVIGQPKHPVVLEVIDRIISKVTKAGKAVGIIAADAAETKMWIEKGVRYFSVSSDLGMMMSQGKNLMNELKKKG